MFRGTKYTRSPEVKSERTTLPRQHYGRVVATTSTCSWNSKNYISDVTLITFFPILEKYRALKPTRQLSVPSQQFISPGYLIYILRCPEDAPEIFGRISYRAEMPISLGYPYDILGYPTEILFPSNGKNLNAFINFGQIQYQSSLMDVIYLCVVSGR